jgi:subtilase family serine protease
MKITRLILIAGLFMFVPSSATLSVERLDWQESSESEGYFFFLSNANSTEPALQPDLKIQQYLFSPGNDKSLKAHVINTGTAVSGLCIFRLTVRKINGVSVGRVTEVKLPPLAAGKEKWLIVNAKSILPNNISLESTTFKLNADATSIVAESDEANNEVWHNLEISVVFIEETN